MEASTTHHSANANSAAPIHAPPQGQAAGLQPQPSIVVAALSRGKWLVLALAVLLAAGGVAVGLKRKPVWTASATLQVGRANPNSPGFYGFVQSATDLATTFSREVDADGVLARIQRATGLAPTEAVRRISASPIPDGAAFQVFATGPSGPAAIRLANVAAGATVSYLGSTSFIGGDAGAIYGQYRAESLQLAQAQAQVQRLKNNAGPNNPTNQALVKAEAQASSLQARTGALSAAYTQAIESGPTVSSLVSPLSRALTASSDRKHKIELFGIAGLVAGLLIGGAAAILREQRGGSLRRRRHPIAREAVLLEEQGE